jgi:hypothetical protein
MAGAVRKQSFARRKFGLRRFRSGRTAWAGAWFGCCALLLQFLIPLVHGPRGPLSAQGVPLWTALCAVVPDKPAAPPSDPSRSNPANDRTAAFCPVCLGVQIAGTFLPPAPIVLPIAPAGEQARFVPRAERAAGSSVWMAAQPRGPPIAV